MKKSEAQRDIIPFVRKHDYVFEKELGNGACGQTILLRDDQIDELFVCKKLTPYSEEERQELFLNSVRETKILHQIYHENVVRIFNYYLYPEKFTGFILMELVDGVDIDDYLKQIPEMINEVFLQTIKGFHYLEENNILHRDIRPANIMVRSDGGVKIIDFGFGKQITGAHDFNKSVSLNWWCDLPNEFSQNSYNFTTEVYFVGKLFEKIVSENHIEQFKYLDILSNMCKRDLSERTSGFADIMTGIQSDMFFEIAFNEEEMESYRNFADEIEKCLSKLQAQTKYIANINQIQTTLENEYRSFMLEKTVPDSAVVIRCLIDGAYYYRSKNLPVWVIKDFIHLLKSSSPEKKRIILSNLHARLNSITRYDEPDTTNDDDIPF